MSLTYGQETKTKVYHQHPTSNHVHVLNTFKPEELSHTRDYYSPVQMNEVQQPFQLWSSRPRQLSSHPEKIIFFPYSEKIYIFSNAETLGTFGGKKRIVRKVVGVEKLLQDVIYEGACKNMETTQISSSNSLFFPCPTIDSLWSFPCVSR